MATNCEFEPLKLFISRFQKGIAFGDLLRFSGDLIGNANNSQLSLERFPKVQYRIDRSLPVSDTVSPAKISRVSYL